MGVEFANGVPGCCCCRDVYVRTNRVEMHRVRDQESEYIAEYRTQPLPDTLAFDWVNGRLFSRDNNFDTISSLAKDLTDRRVEATTPSGIDIIRGITVHPWTQTIFYGARPSTSSDYRIFIRRVNFGGGGDTPIWEFEDDTGIAGLQRPQLLSLACAKKGLIFGVAIFDQAEDPNISGPDISNYDDFIIRMGLNGEAPTIVYTESNPQRPSRLAMCVNNDDEELYFTNSVVILPGEPAETHSTRIYRLPFNGGAQIVYEEFGGATSGPVFDLFGYSHINSRIFFWRRRLHDNLPNLQGLYSIDRFGNNLRMECSFTDWASQPDGSKLKQHPIFQRLGCGFDTIGVNAVASS